MSVASTVVRWTMFRGCESVHVTLYWWPSPTAAPAAHLLIPSTHACARSEASLQPRMILAHDSASLRPSQDGLGEARPSPPCPVGLPFRHVFAVDAAQPPLFRFGDQRTDAVHGADSHRRRLAHLFAPRLTAHRTLHARTLHSALPKDPVKLAALVRTALNKLFSCS